MDTDHAILLKVLKHCALGPDLALFEAGDATEVRSADCTSTV